MPVRVIIAAGLVIALLLVFLAFLLATDTALSVWDRLKAAPLWLQIAYGALLFLVSAASLVLVWRVLRPKKKPRAEETTTHQPVDASALEQEIAEAAQSGVDVSDAIRELEERRARNSGGKIYIALCGEVSTGKSSLVAALLPDARIATDPRAGTTTEVTRYAWRSPGGDEIMIADLPGFNLDENREAREECLRAHLVVFLCTGDLTASQAAQLKHLRGFDKPMILALNKADRFNQEELALIMARLQEKSALGAEDVIAISSGDAQRDSNIEPLLHRMQAHLDRDADLMESLRDTTVLMLAGEKLRDARRRHLDEQAEALVNRYSRRAVVGALAAVAPGSDLIIQGLLGSQLLRELAALYGAQVRDVEIDSFLQLAEGRIRNMSAITLAIAGNALKAFPGLGTLTGGLVHAVAYGMIFDSLGRAAAKSIANRGELRPAPAARDFEELMNENLGSGAVRFARLALEEKRSKRED